MSFNIDDVMEVLALVKECKDTELYIDTGEMKLSLVKGKVSSGRNIFEPGAAPVAETQQQLTIGMVIIPWRLKYKVTHTTTILTTITVLMIILRQLTVRMKTISSPSITIHSQMSAKSWHNSRRKFPMSRHWPIVISKAGRAVRSLTRRGRFLGKHTAYIHRTPY